MAGVRIDQWDILVLVFYFVGVLSSGFAAMFAAKRGTVSGFYLAGRFMSWLPVGASLFASNIGSEHFIGLAGSGAAAGFGVGAFELNATILLQLLGWVFLPVYISSRVCTLPEFMMKRFGGKRIQIYLAGLSLLLYVFTKISVNLYSGSLFLAEAVEWNVWWSILLQLGLTTLITVLGGLAAVLYTDTLQFFVMVIGAIILAILAFVRVGGFSGLLMNYAHAIAHVNASSAEGSELLLALANASRTTNGTLSELATYVSGVANLQCGLPAPKAFKLLRELDDPDMPWLGFLLGQTPASIWYWCADQMMVQRALAAKSLSHAQGATLMAGVIKILPLFIMVIPGMISRVLFADEIACLPGDDCFRICGHRTGCTDMAYPKLVFGLMPSGLRGLMLAVMLAALISDLTSIFNSASTLFAVDIYRHIRKRARDAELVLVGRLFVLFLVAISILWVPMIQKTQGGQLYIYIQGVAACLAPPIAAVYLLTVLWKRSTEPGAFFALMSGLLIGLIRLILTIVYHDPVCGEADYRPAIVARLHYMYFALLSFLVTGLVMIIVSLATRPPTQLARLTYWTAWAAPSEPINSTPTPIVSYHVVNAFRASISYEKSMNQLGDSLDPVVQEQPVICEKYEHGEDAVVVQMRSMKDLCACESSGGQCLRHIGLWLCGCEEHMCSTRMQESCLACVCCGNKHVPNCCRAKFNDDDDSIESEEKRQQEAAQDEARMRRVCSLEQDPRAKIALNTILVIVFIMVVFLYIFFSVYFDIICAGPLPVWVDRTWNGSAVNLTIDILSELERRQVIHISRVLM